MWGVSADASVFGGARRAVGTGRAQDSLGPGGQPWPLPVRREWPAADGVALTCALREEHSAPGERTPPLPEFRGKQALAGFILVGLRSVKNPFYELGSVLSTSLIP